jgi:hypothetical protein
MNKDKDKIIIHLMTNEINGSFILSAGSIDSYNTEIEICKNKHLDDYKTVIDWIDRTLD